MRSSGLFVADVPQYLTDEQFQNLWTNVPGLVDARLRRDKKDRVVGFVDFVDEEYAAKARDQFQGFSFDSSHGGISIHFTKSNPVRRRSGEEDEFSGSLSSSSNSPRQAVGGVQLPEFDFLSLNDSSALQNSRGSLQQRHVPRRGSVDGSHGSRHDSALKGMTVPRSTLYVEGVPTDASEREVSHVFRPFPGFHSLRLFEKSGRKGNYTLCFVEFDNQENATHALLTLQGYRFDHKNDTRGIAIRYARQRGGSVSTVRSRSPSRSQPTKRLNPPGFHLHGQQGLVSSSSSTSTSSSSSSDHIFNSSVLSTPLTSPGFEHNTSSSSFQSSTTAQATNNNNPLSLFDDRYGFDPAQVALPTEFQRIFQPSASGFAPKADSMWQV